HIRELGCPRDVPERLIHILHGLAIPLDCVALAKPFPAPQMRYQPSGQWDRRSTLFRLTLARRAAKEDPLLKVDPPLSLCRRQRGPADGTGSRAGIHGYQDEACD